MPTNLKNLKKYLKEMPKKNILCIIKQVLKGYLKSTKIIKLSKVLKRTKGDKVCQKFQKYQMAKM